MRSTLAVAVFVSFVGTGCTDKAKVNYDKCMTSFDAGNLTAASDACKGAVTDDPTSVSGKAAKDELTGVIEPALAARQKAATDKAAADAVLAAQAAERTRLLSSTDPNDWTTLIAKYPDSPEAARAKDMLTRASSICADLSTFTISLRAASSDLRAVMPELRGKNQGASGAGVLRNFNALQVETKASADKYAGERDLVQNHGKTKGEGQIVKDIANAFDTISLAFAKYSKLFEDGLDNMAAMGELEEMLEPLRGTTLKLIDDEGARCAKLVPVDGGTPTPSTTTATTPTASMIAVKCPAGYSSQGNRGGGCWCVQDGADDQIVPVKAPHPGCNLTGQGKDGKSCTYRCP